MFYITLLASSMHVRFLFCLYNLGSLVCQLSVLPDSLAEVCHYNFICHQSMSLMQVYTFFVS